MYYPSFFKGGFVIILWLTGWITLIVVLVNCVVPVKMTIYYVLYFLTNAREKKNHRKGELSELNKMECEGK